MGKSFLGSTRQAGWPQSKEGMEGSKPWEAKFLHNPRRKLKQWMEQFEETGRVEFDDKTFDAYREGFISGSVSDEDTMAVIKDVFEDEGYLLDPHAAVSLAVAHALKEEIEEDKIIFLATAHPAKFPKIIQESLGCETLPAAAFHPSIEKAKWIV